MLITLVPGPSIVSFPTVEASVKTPAGGNENAHGSNQRLGVWSGCPAGMPAQPAVTPLVGLLLKPGFRFGRSGVVVSPFADWLNPVRTLYGSPEPYCQIPLTVHPPASIFSACPFRCLSNGRLYW